MLVIGSTAAHYHFPESRISGDTNIWSTEEEYQGFLQRNKCTIDRVDNTRARLRYLVANGDESISFEIAEHSETVRALLSHALSRKTIALEPYKTEAQIATPEELLAIRRSHLYYPIAWNKHINAYHELKKEVPTLSTETEKWCSMRIAELQCRLSHRYNGATKSLMMSNEEFFGGYQHSFMRVYEHDDLHKATKYYETPLYDSLKENKEMAYVPKKNFLKLSEKDKYRLVREEAFAIALERVIIPAIEHGHSFSADDAFGFAIRRICTNLTRGWFRDFSIENYPEIRKSDKDFFEAFLNAVEKGRISRKRTEPWTDEDRERAKQYFMTYLDEWDYE